MTTVVTTSDDLFQGYQRDVPLDLSGHDRSEHQARRRSCAWRSRRPSGRNTSATTRARPRLWTGSTEARLSGSTPSRRSLVQRREPDLGQGDRLARRGPRGHSARRTSATSSCGSPEARGHSLRGDLLPDPDRRFERAAPGVDSERALTARPSSRRPRAAAARFGATNGNLLTGGGVTTAELDQAPTSGRRSSSSSSSRTPRVSLSSRTTSRTRA